MEKTFLVIEAEFETLKAEFAKFSEKGNKAAGTRARNAAMDLTKLLKQLRAEIQSEKKK